MARLVLPLVVLALAATAPAQPGGPPKSFADVAKVTAEVDPATAKRGATVTVRVTVRPEFGAWTYPIHPKDPRQESKNRFALPAVGEKGFAGLVPVGGPAADPTAAEWKFKPETLEGVTVDTQYSSAAVTWELAAVVSPQATPGKKELVLDPAGTSVQACVRDYCFPARTLPTAAFVVADAPPVEVEGRFRAEVEKALAPPAAPVGVRGGPVAEPVAAKSVGESAKTARPADEYREGLLGLKLDTSAVPPSAEQESLWGFVLTAALWGLISLVTPCVFPMIPITVSIFLKQAGGSVRQRVKLAGVYCLTIILVLGVSAFALLRFMAVLSAHPVTNVLLGGLFVVLALSLFGMYELTLPNGLARRFQSGQSRGGVAGTVAGALAFTVISFTCVAPFLGGFAGISAAGGDAALIALPTGRELAGGLAFATAFAAPFFVLAMVPGLLRSLPRSGGWLDSVKAVMGFLELAAALKFFRTAELRVFSPPAYFTYDLVLAGWVAIASGCGLYLLNLYRLPHDEERPNIGVPRLLFALLFLGLGAYLLPAMFKRPDGRGQRPAGAVYAWVNAFLLPEPGQTTDEGWGTDLKEALAKSRAEKLAGRPAVPVFVDFTGVTCTNCRYNESEVFPRPAVREELAKFERVKLYTDDVPAGYFAVDPGLRARNAEARANGDFKVKAFGTEQNPLYVVLVPTLTNQVRVLEVYKEGKINDPDKFVEFLKRTRAAGGG